MNTNYVPDPVLRPRKSKERDSGLMNKKISDSVKQIKQGNMIQ